MYSHLFSIITGKEPAKEHETSEKMKQQTDKSKNSTDEGQEERKQNAFPTNYQHDCTSYSNRIYTSYHVLK